MPSVITLMLRRKRRKSIESVTNKSIMFIIVSLMVDNRSNNEYYLVPNICAIERRNVTAS